MNTPSDKQIEKFYRSNLASYMKEETDSDDAKEVISSIKEFIAKFIQSNFEKVNKKIR